MTKEDKHHPNLLTEAEWQKAIPPFYMIEVPFKEWKHVHYEIATKWLLLHSTGWVYRTDKTFIIEKEEDFCLFKLWAEKEPMTEDQFELAVK